METVTINIPDDKSELVKQVLAEMGVTIEPTGAEKQKRAAYREKLLKISVWSDEEIKPIEDARQHFNFKPEEW